MVFEGSDILEIHIRKSIWHLRFRNGSLQDISLNCHWFSFSYNYYYITNIVMAKKYEILTLLFNFTLQTLWEKMFFLQIILVVFLCAILQWFGGITANNDNRDFAGTLKLKWSWRDLSESRENSMLITNIWHLSKQISAMKATMSMF